MSPRALLAAAAAVAAVAFCAAAAAAAAAALETASSSSSPPPPQVCDPSNYRDNCGYVGITESECTGKGCCWLPSVSSDPWCFYKTSPTLGYEVTSASTDPASGVTTLALALLSGSARYGADIAPLRVIIAPQSATTVRITIDDGADSTRWRVPESIVPLAPPQPFSSFEPMFSVTYTSSPFGFAVTRLSDNYVMFNSTPPAAGVDYFDGLIFEDQFLSVSTHIDTDARLIGFGEHSSNNLTWSSNGTNSFFTLWSIDNAAMTTHQNLYGQHPFSLTINDRGRAHGVLLLNTNGMDVLRTPGGALTYRTIGGILDFFVFVGSDPETVVQQYHQLIGTPALPPYWALGWHQCRYGYRNLAEVEQVVANYSAAQIPLDVVWIDIDYMDAFQDFTYDPVNFSAAAVNTFVTGLHAKSMYFVPIVDPAIHLQSGYAPYDAGVAANVFILAANGSALVAAQWPGLAVVPDFLLDRTATWWQQMITDFHELAPFDGLWTDMNEFSNFCTGECNAPPSDSPYSNPPYAINNLDSLAPLETRQLSMDALVNDSAQIYYNTHSLYGHSEALATVAALETLRGQRAFVLSRSTTIGTGRKAAHWLGDNVSTFASMAQSLPGIMLMNMFGINLVGADVCGFNGDTTEELCARWTALGAFYPFARNHNTISAIDQFPYLWPTVAQAARTCLAARYSMIPYYYTLFYEANVSGGTVMRPLLFEWVLDPHVATADQQFMIGDALLFSPVLVEGVLSVDAYLPLGEVWYDWWTYEPVAAGFHTFSVPLNTTQINIRGGYVLPLQAPEMTLAATRQNPFEMLVALSASAEALGTLYWDDGVSIDASSTATLVTMQCQESTFTSAIASGGGAGAEAIAIDAVRVLASGGGLSGVSSVLVNGASWSSWQALSDTELLVSSLSSGPNLKVSWS